MEIQFGINSSDRKKVEKNVLFQNPIEMKLKQPTSIEEPTIIVRMSSNVLNCNYAYIPDLKRFYYVEYYTAIANDLLEVKLLEDFLYSNSSSIRGLTCLVDRQEYKFSPMIEDSVLTSRLKCNRVLGSEKLYTFNGSNFRNYLTVVG